MKKRMVFVIFLSVIFLSVLTVAAAEVNHYYKIDISYDIGEITYKSIKIEPAINKVENVKGVYAAEIVSFDNQILEITFFAIPTTVFFDIFDQETGEIIGGGTRELNQSEVTIYVPYYANAREINIYDQDLNLKLSIDVGSYSKEISGDVEEVTSLEITEEKETIKEKPKQFIVKSVVFVLLLLLLLIVILLIMRKKRQ